MTRTLTFLGITLLMIIGIGTLWQESFAAAPVNCARIAKLQSRPALTNRVKRLAARCAALTKTSSRLSASSSPAKLWGAYVGWEAEEGPAFEAKVGMPMQLRATFVHWGNDAEFPLHLTETTKDKTLVIFWEAMDYHVASIDQPRYSYAAILRGDWDIYFKTFAEQARIYGGPVILIPFEEMNGDWYPWSGTKNGNSPAQHIDAYRYIREFFRDTPNVKFGWAVNGDSVPDTAGNRIADYYPGDAFVDYVGVDGFNFGDPWMTFDEIYGSALQQLKTFKKPIYIFSMASADGPKKAAWIADALTAELPKYPEVKGWVWFNENKERDWRVWSDDASLEAFKKAIRIK